MSTTRHNILLTLEIDTEAVMTDGEWESVADYVKNIGGFITPDVYDNWHGVVSIIAETFLAGRNPWDLTREHGAEYEEWREDTRDGSTLLGFAEWLHQRQLDEQAVR